MRKRAFGKTMLHKLILSYFVLVVGATLCTGLFAYISFSRNYAREVEEINRVALVNLKKGLDTQLFSKMGDVLTSMTLNIKPNDDLLFFFNSGIQGNHARLIRSLARLEDLKAANGFAEDISVYYRNSNSILSTSSGVSYLDAERGHAYLSNNWLNAAIEDGRSELWMSSQERQQARGIVQVRRYPYGGPFATHKGYVSVTVGEETLRSLVMPLAPDNCVSVALLDAAHGQIVFQWDRAGEGALPASLIDRLTGAAGPGGWISETLNGTACIVSYDTFDRCPWRIVMVTPMHDYYRNMDVIGGMIALISAVTLALGMLISVLFSRRLYRPLKALSTSASRMTPAAREIEQGDEYATINGAIRALSERLGTLQQTLELNGPAIRRNFVLGLVNGSIRSESELAQYLELIEPRPDGLARCGVLLMELKRSAVQALSVENRQFIRYSIAEYMQSLQDDCLTAELSDTRFVAIYFWEDEQDEKQGMLRLAENLARHVKDCFSLEAVVGIGRVHESLLDMSDSYADACSALRHAYFMPGQSAISVDDIVGRVSYAQRALMQLDELREALYSQDRAKVHQRIQVAVMRLIDGKYTADFCHNSVLGMVLSFLDFLREIGLGEDSLPGGDVLEAFSGLDDLEAFAEWFELLCNRAIDALERRDKDRRKTTIEEVKRYVIENLGRDLPLNDIAEHFHFSAQHLSRLFKEITGSGLIEYILDRRLERARSLLIDTDLSIDQIALEVGFNSTTYFIKQFKARHSVTPRQYRLSSRVEEDKR